MQISDVLAERQKTHGSFEDHAQIAQALKQIMHDSPNWHALTPVYKEGLEMIAHKLARVCSGDPLFLDAYRDIIGYTQLMVNQLQITEGATDVVNTRTVLEKGSWRPQAVE